MNEDSAAEDSQASEPTPDRAKPAKAKPDEAKNWDVTKIPSWNGFLRLADVHQFFGCSMPQAMRKAAQMELPVPAFKPGNQKAEWLIAEKDLLSYFREQHKAAAKDHRLKAVASGN
ncbi:MAG: hypothetical protein AAF515_05205 [Pseudomonadota bacterium]